MYKRLVKKIKDNPEEVLLFGGTAITVLFFLYRKEYKAAAHNGKIVDVYDGIFRQAMNNGFAPLANYEDHTDWILQATQITDDVEAVIHILPKTS